MKGKINITRIHNCKTGKEHMTITVEDELSGIEFVNVGISFKNFSKALTGQGYIPIVYTLKGIKHVGKKYQHKTVLIHLHSFGDLNDKEIDKAVSEHEIDGWIGSRADCKNHHNWTTDLNSHDVAARVTYHRWVEKEKTDGQD